MELEMSSSKQDDEADEILTHTQRLLIGGRMTIDPSPASARDGKEVLPWEEFWHWAGNRWPLRDETHPAHDSGPAQRTRIKLCFHCALEANAEEWQFCDEGVRVDLRRVKQ
jgi:hypothetical protein